MADEDRGRGSGSAPYEPGLAWRAGAFLVMGFSGLFSGIFLRTASNVHVQGLDAFLDLLDRRRDIEGRQKGLLTVSNHLSILDDPIIWGVFPFSYMWSPNNLRWSLASHDLIFQKRPIALFFNMGQTMPTHRLAHSPHGGLFQPTMTQAIRLLSRQPFTRVPSEPASYRPASMPDPFSENQLYYSTDGHDWFPKPSAYGARRHAWVHIFPEGRIHQHRHPPEYTMRYFKWGVSRLILESEPCPDIVPIWLEGFDQVMHESRTFPRPLPRPGKDVKVVFGDILDSEQVFGDLRRRWKTLCEQEWQAEKKERERRGDPADPAWEIGVLESDKLKYGEEAVNIRKECTLRIREEVAKLRRRQGWQDEDPKASFADAWKIEGHNGKREGQMEDGSWVRDT